MPKIKITRTRITNQAALFEHTTIIEILSWRASGGGFVGGGKCIGKTKLIGACRIEDVKEIVGIRDEDGEVIYQESSWSTDVFLGKSSRKAWWNEFMEIDLIEIDDGMWIDPAGGVHHEDEDDPAKMYE